MTTDFDTYGLTPKEFAILAKTSMYKIGRDEALADQVSREVRQVLDDIESFIDDSAVSWLRSNLSDEIPLTPLKVWKYNPRLHYLLSNPEKELDKCCPEWRFLIFTGVNKANSRTTK